MMIIRKIFLTLLILFFASFSFAGQALFDKSSDTMGDIAGYTVYSLGNQSGTLEIDLSDGVVQSLSLTGDLSITFTGWPSAGTEGKCILYIENDSHMLTIGSLDFEIAATGWSAIQVSTIDGGATLIGGFPNLVDPDGWGVVVARSVSTSLDAVLSDGTANVTTSLDAILMSSGTASASLDAVLMFVGTKTVSLDAVLIDDTPEYVEVSYAGGTATSDLSTYLTYIPAYAVDDNIANGWIGTGSTGYWQFYFGSETAHKIRRVRVRCAHTTTVTSIQGSTNGTDFTTLTSGSSDTSAYDTWVNIDFTGNNNSYNYIRINGTGSGYNGFLEVELMTYE